MRTIPKFILISCVAAGGIFVYTKKYADRFRVLHKTTFKTERPTRRDIVRKAVFSGKLIPHKEIHLEAHITGVVERLLVNVGDYVREGAAIARIKIKSDLKEIEAAESKLRLAAIDLTKTRSQHIRQKQLFHKKMIAKAVYESALATWEEAKEKFSAAKKELQIVQCGYIKGKGAEANLIKATTKGTILNLPIKEGGMVQAIGGQSPGTVVAVIGDMDHFLFSAKVNELDVVHLTKGMSFEVSLNAFKEEKLPVTLTKVSLKSSEEESKGGAVMFEIEGMVTKPKHSKIILRAGYLALAEVIIEQVRHVLAVPEKMIQTEGKSCFVKCLHGGESIQKDVVLGLSDGFYVEVKEGLTEEDQLIVEE